MKIFLMIVAISFIVNIVIILVNELIERSKNKMIDEFVKELHEDRKKEEETK